MIFHCLHRLVSLCWSSDDVNAFFQVCFANDKNKENNLFSHRYLGLVLTLLAKAEIPPLPRKKKSGRRRFGCLADFLVVVTLFTLDALISCTNLSACFAVKMMDFFF